MPRNVDCMACLASLEMFEDIVEYGGVVHKAKWVTARGAYLLCDVTGREMYDAKLIKDPRGVDCMACLSCDDDQYVEDGIVEHAGVVHRTCWITSRGAYLMCDVATGGPLNVRNPFVLIKKRKERNVEQR